MMRPVSARAPKSRVLRRFTAFALVLAVSLLVGFLSLKAQDELPRNETRFTMARIYYSVPDLRWWGPIGAGNGPPWSHDWPNSEAHFMKIMAEVTKLDVNPGGHITSFQTDDCFKYPIAYLCEPGFMNLSEPEAQRMGEYLLRGGFLIVDDFRGPRELDNFIRQMRIVFPDRSLEELPRSHPIWTCFYDITNVFPQPYQRGYTPQYLGMSDDKGRLMLVADYNNDISEYWEWSNDPFYPIEETNDAYKYGVNYVMYALTH